MYKKLLIQVHSNNSEAKVISLIIKSIKILNKKIRFIQCTKILSNDIIGIHQAKILFKNTGWFIENIIDYSIVITIQKFTNFRGGSIGERRELVLPYPSVGIKM